MKLREFVATKSFFSGEYRISSPISSSLLGLLRFALLADDEDGSRHVPTFIFEDLADSQTQKAVLAAMVRAGARHPGILVDDLARLHRAAMEEGQIELFSDLNALTTGLLVHIIESLGKKVARVIISSSSIDVLHEYQSRYVAEARLGRAEMVRALRVLDDVRRTIPVHIHQLPPGAARYFLRTEAQPRDASVQEEGYEDSLYISEDRQMMGAFWDYQTQSNPRIPVFLVTSDFNLAHVCAAERAPFIFAQTPYEFWRRRKGPIQLDSLWFDPFALALRACLPHLVLWELSLVFSSIRVLRAGSEPRDEFTLSYDHRKQRPGKQEEVEVDLAPAPWAAPQVGISKTPTKPTKTLLASNSRDRRIKLSLPRIIDVLPTRKGQSVPLSLFLASDEDSLRQLRQVGQATELYEVKETEVVDGPSLAQLLASLASNDYLGVNEIFRRHPTYARVLDEARTHGRFPSSKIAGAATGWAIMLGAAYKTKSGTLFGLAEISEQKFEETVVRFHKELGDGQAAASLPRILDRSCHALRLSPIRFEAMLARGLGQGALSTFELQRASVDIDIPHHPVLVWPTSALSESYVRVMEPGRGLVINRILVSSLVRRSGRT